MIGVIVLNRPKRFNEPQRMAVSVTTFTITVINLFNKIHFLPIKQKLQSVITDQGVPKVPSMCAGAVTICPCPSKGPLLGEGSLPHLTPWAEPGHRELMLCQCPAFPQCH